MTRQHAKHRLTARERIARLIDPAHDFFELGLWAAWGMYREWGGARRPASSPASASSRAGRHGRRQRRHGQGRRLLPDDLQEGAARRSASPSKTACRSSTSWTAPASSCRLQDEVFPDEDDFGRIFRNNAVISASGLPQFAAIVGNCVAGGGYLPVLCDKLLMTEGSGLYLAGPALVKAAIGQTVSHEDLGGAAMHAAVSGTIDFRERTTSSVWSGCAASSVLLPPDSARSRAGGSPRAGRRPTCCSSPVRPSP